MDYNISEFWNSIAMKAFEYRKFVLYKNDAVYGKVPHISESRIFRRSIGSPRGQMADWRLSIRGETSGIHAVEYIDRYEIHVDRFDPYKRPVKHLIYDAPTYAALIAAPILSAAISFLL
ncbi:MAG: hypothetical protein ACP5UV_05335 [Thermoplasmata archaeon]